MCGGQSGWIAINASADAGEGNGLKAIVGSQLQRMGIAGGEQCRLAVLSIPPNGAYGVDDEAGGEAKARAYFGLPRGAAVECAAIGQQLRTGGAVDGSVNATATQKAAVGGVDNSVDGQCRNVGANGTQRGGHGGRRIHESLHEARINPSIRS